MLNKLSESTVSIMARVQVQHLRTRILIVLDRLYPQMLDEEAIFDSLHQMNFECGMNAMQRELHYLAEKGFIALKLRNDKKFKVGLIAKSRDFLSGDIAEVGLVPASALQYLDPSACS